jgi:hypothetical protein
MGSNSVFPGGDARRTSPLVGTRGKNPADPESCTAQRVCKSVNEACGRTVMDDRLCAGLKLRGRNVI